MCLQVNKKFLNNINKEDFKYFLATSHEVIFNVLKCKCGRKR